MAEKEKEETSEHETSEESELIEDIEEAEAEEEQEAVQQGKQDLSSVPQQSFGFKAPPVVLASNAPPQQTEIQKQSQDRSVFERETHRREEVYAARIKKAQQQSSQYTPTPTAPDTSLKRDATSRVQTRRQLSNNSLNQRSIQDQGPRDRYQSSTSAGGQQNKRRRVWEGG